MVSAAILTLVNLHFLTIQCVPYQIRNIPTKFGAHWSNSKEMATTCRNLRWQRPPSWTLVNMHLKVTIAFFVIVSTFPSNLVRIGSIVKKWQQFLEIQDGGGSHLEEYTSGWTASIRKELLVCNFQSKIILCGVILTFKGSLLLRVLMLKRFPLQIGKVQKTGWNFSAFWAGNPLKCIWLLHTMKRHVYKTDHVVWAIKRANRSRIATCRRDEATGK